MKNKILLGLLLSIFLIGLVNADSDIIFCQDVLTCYDNGIDVQGQTACNCSVLTLNGDNQYLGGLSLDKGLSTRSLTLAEGVINLSMSFPYSEVNITNATLNVNQLIAGTLDYCYIQYSVDSGSTWTNLRTCTTDSTGANYIYDLSDLSQSELENLWINYTGLRSGGAVYGYIKLDSVNLSLEYSEISAPELPAQEGQSQDEIYSIFESTGAGLGSFILSVSQALPNLLIILPLIALMIIPITIVIVIKKIVK